MLQTISYPRACQRRLSAVAQIRAKSGPSGSLADRVIGHVDPGAVSVPRLLKSCSATL